MLDRFCVTELPGLISKAGTSRFLPGVMGAFNRSLTAVDICALFRYDAAARPASFGAASSELEEVTRLTAERYVSGLGLHDPMLPLLHGLQPGDVPITFHLQPDQIRNENYREQNYIRTNTVERFSILFRDEISCYSVNFYRKRSSGVFRAPERQALKDLAPLLASLSLKHVAISGMSRVATSEDPATRIARRLRDRSDSLSDRECQICSLIVLGHSSESISLKLGLSVNTVLTYRKRAYAKLGIGSQNELFRICLD